MTNYNDGKWHGWNGGECPVHPETVVEGVYWNPEEDALDVRSPVTDRALCFDWKRDFDFILLAFRVIKEYKEPLEWWVWDCRLFFNEGDAMNAYIRDTSKYPTLKGKAKPCKVREVLA